MTPAGGPAARRRSRPLGRLRRPDESLLVPGEVAGEMWRALVMVLSNREAAAEVGKVVSQAALATGAAAAPRRRRRVGRQPALRALRREPGAGREAVAGTERMRSWACLLARCSSSGVASGERLLGERSD